MSVPKSKAYPTPASKQQPPTKKGQEVKAVKKAWNANDYANESVSV